MPCRPLPSSPVASRSWLLTGKPTGADSQDGGDERGTSQLAPPLHIPKNRSTGNLAAADNVDRSRYRFSFDAGPSTAEYESHTRSVASSCLRVDRGEDEDEGESVRDKDRETEHIVQHHNASCLPC